MEETAVYMPDYVVDEFGVLKEIRFDIIKNCQIKPNVKADMEEPMKKEAPLNRKIFHIKIK